MTELELLRHAIRANHDMLLAVQTTLHVSSATSFPIENETSLLSLWKEGVESVQLPDASFTKDQLKTRFPKSFYPIRNAEDLFGKMYAALLHGRRMHEIDAERNTSKRHIEGKGRER